MTNRTGYDAWDASRIPAVANSPQSVVLGYDHWTPSDWGRFPRAVKVRIAQQDSQTGIQYSVLDVENGDATISQARGWIEGQQRIGAKWNTIYVQESNLSWLRAACKNLSYYIWVAWWREPVELLEGTVGTQYRNMGADGYDLSVFTDDAWHPVGSV